MRTQFDFLFRGLEAMYEDKTLITVDDIIRASELSRKITRCVLIFIWIVVILGGLKYKAIIAWTITAAVLSVFVLAVYLHNSTKVRCIDNKRLVIKDDVIDDLIEVSRHESEDCYVVLRNAGKESILYIDYKEMEVKDRVYVFEYLNKRGKCIIRNIYLHKKYKISPELLEFYKRSEEEREGFYE